MSTAYQIAEFGRHHLYCSIYEVPSELLEVINNLGVYCSPDSTLGTALHTANINTAVNQLI